MSPQRTALFDSTTIASVVAIGLTIIGILVTIGIRWGGLEQRVKGLEDRERYMHGSYGIPTP